MWLGPVLGASDTVEITDVDAPASTGYSAETVMFTASHDGRSARLVLRAETADPAIYPAQGPGHDIEIEIQRRVMDAVASASNVPLARILGSSNDPGVIGTPFFVMEFIDGAVPAVDPPYTQAGFVVDGPPRSRHALVEDGLRVLAMVHAIDWRAAGLTWLVPPGSAPSTARQLEIWEGYAARELGSRRHPLLERAFARLRSSLPAGSPPSLCWGDPRPGNMIWREYRCVCVTDWEAAAIAPPEVDLGWWLMFDRSCHEVVEVPRLEGEPTREEQTAIYERYAGRSVGDTEIYELFAAARYAAIVVRVMNRAVDRGQLPPDHTIWLENPAVRCLAQLMGT